MAVKCLPGNIPENIRVDLSPLELGQSIEAGALELPEKVMLADDEHVVVCTVAIPRGQDEEEEAEAAEGEAAEGEAAEGEAKGGTEAKSKDSEGPQSCPRTSFPRAGHRSLSAGVRREIGVPGSSATLRLTVAAGCSGTM